MTQLDLDARKRRIKIRAWRRGLREVDLILGGFVDAHLDTLDEAGVVEFERLLDASDRDVFAWFSGEEPLPSDYDGPVFARIKAFHQHVSPINL